MSGIDSGPAREPKEPVLFEVYPKTETTAFFKASAVLGADSLLDIVDPHYSNYNLKYISQLFNVSYTSPFEKFFHTVMFPKYCSLLRTKES
jgi:hypothetical protein